jgi:hypothetical protein
MDQFDWQSPDDVLVVSAMRSLGNLLERLRESTAAWIVMVRQHPETDEIYYYVFRRDELEAFRTTDAGTLARSAAEALDMHECTSSAVSRNGRPASDWGGGSGPTGHRAVDFDYDGNVRQIGEIATSAAVPGNGGPAPTDEQLLDDLGATRGGGGHRGAGSIAGASRDTAVDDNAIDITMSAETEGELAVGDPAMVVFRIELTSEASPLEHSVPSPARKDVDMYVSLSVENDVIEVLDDQAQQVPPPQSGQFRSGFFRIRATRTGLCRLAVRFRQGGADLAVIPMAVEVVDESARAKPVRAEASAAPRDSTVDEKLTLTVELREEHGQVYYNYLLFSEPLNFHGKQFRSAPLKDRGDSPAGTITAYVKRIYDQVARKLQGDIAGDLKRLQREVRALGANLSDELLDPDLVRTLWPYRDKISLIELISWEPYIPWEMVRLQHPDTGEIDEKFLAEYGLVRTLSDTSPPRELPARKWTYYRAQFPSGMYPAVGAEIDYFTKTGPGTLRAHNIEADALEDGEDAFYDALAEGDFDILHLACHAEGDEAEIDRAQLIIGEASDPGGDARPVAVGPSILKAEARWKTRHPVVFLNACETGRAGALLTAWGGWPNVFMRCGAGVFIGSAWPVRDGPASRFAAALYESLLSGATLADAATSAREAARTSASGAELDASWLAFKVYGHPRARFVAQDDA